MEENEQKLYLDANANYFCVPLTPILDINSSSRPRTPNGARPNRFEEDNDDDNNINDDNNNNNREDDNVTETSSLINGPSILRRQRLQTTSNWAKVKMNCVVLRYEM